MPEDGNEYDILRLVWMNYRNSLRRGTGSVIIVLE